MINQIKNYNANTTQPSYKTILGHTLYYPTPINLNYNYSYGSLSGIFFFFQIISGFFLAMHYIPQTEFAFDSVVFIMREVNYGWLARYIHMNGASMIFIFLYLHIGRGIYFASYKGTRKYVWWSGITIFLLMMATAFIGYVLPWGQMSLWGATVITNFVTAIPYIGTKIVYWIWGGFSVNGATLTRFYSLHYFLPFVILGLILSHLVLLHQVGSSNSSQKLDNAKLYFHPFFNYKDLFILSVSLLVFIILVFFYPNLLGHPDNYIKANPLSTPAHIVPEWYFTPFYAILRTCTSKIGGVISMLLAILILYLLPLNSYFKTKNQPLLTNNEYHRLFFWLFAFVFLILIFLGGNPAEQPYILLSRIFAIFYFVYFLATIFNMVSYCYEIVNYSFQPNTNEK